MKPKHTVVRALVISLAMALGGTACSHAPTQHDQAEHRNDAAAAKAGPADAVSAQAQYERFASTMRAHAIPGAQLAYSRDGRTATFSYGVARLDEARPVTDASIFEAASLSKVVGAYIALRLVDRGTLDLDTPLWDYWPSPRIAHDAEARKITTRMVLNHTSGLPNWQISPTNPALDTTPTASAFTPGSRFSYSGEGFYLLQKVIEHLTGMPWNELATQEVFTPFDMPRSGYFNTPLIDALMVRGHTKDGTPRQQRIFTSSNTAFTLMTCASDYHNFIQRALYRGEGLKPETHAMMFSDSSDADDHNAPNGADPYISWGLGLGIQHIDGRKLVWHWGDNPGYKAFFMLSPDIGDSVLLLTNSQNGPSTYQDVLTGFMGEGPYPAIEWVRAQD